MIKALNTNTPSYILAYREQTPLYRDDFLRHLAAVAQGLRQVSDASVVLYCDDAYWFAVGLLAAWLAGKSVALPGDEIAAQDIAGLQFTQSVIIQFTQQPAPLQQFELPSQAELIVYTSGSTGAAKAIRKTLRQLLNEVATLEQQFGAALQGAVVLATVSHQHIYGLLFRVLWPLVQGRAFSAQAAFFPETLLAQSLQHRKVIWISSPAHYKRLNSSHDWAGIAPHLLALFSSGGILQGDVAESIQSLAGLAIQEVFGSSETGGVAFRQHGAAWRALPGVQIQANAAGALQIKSPHLADEAWYTMDDEVRISSDDSFELLGRLDRIVKIEEKRFALAAIEQALLALPEVKDAAVFAASDGARESISAVIALHDDTQLKALGKFRFCERLKQQLSLPKLAIPRRWRFIAELPRNAQGKLQQRTLAALFQAPNVPTVISPLDAAASPKDHLMQAPVLPSVIRAQRVDNSVSYQLAVNADIAYFAGHFPGQPILPGVTQIHWAVHFARQHWPIPQQFLRMEVIKFQQLIQPDRQISLQLDWDETKQRLNFAYSSSEGAHSSGRLLFGVDK